MRCEALAAVLVLAAFSPAAAQDAGKSADPEAIVDEDFRFRLSRPGPEWHLLDAERAKDLGPQAIAGAISGRGATAVLIVEHVGALDPANALASLVLGFGIPGAVPGNLERVTVAGVESLQQDLTCVHRAQKLRFRIVVIPRPPFLFTLKVWCPDSPEVPSARLLAEPVAALSFLSGEVRPRRPGQQVLEQIGSGWRIHEGVFESAVAGVRVRPGAGWRVCTGLELAKMDENAEVGLCHSFPDLYAVVQFRAAPGGTAAAVEREFRSTYAALAENAPGAKPVAIEIAGERVALEHRQAVEPMPTSFWMATLVRGERVYSVQFWCIESVRADAEKLLGAGGAAISLMTDAERAPLLAAAAAAPDPHCDYALDASYRDGVYRHFGAGLEWRRPPGSWRVKIGSEAIEVDSESAVVLEEPALGVHAALKIVNLEEEGIGSDAELHADALEWLDVTTAPLIPDEDESAESEDEVDSPEMRKGTRAKATLAGQPAFETRAEWGRVESPIFGLLATCRSRSHGVAVRFAGKREAMTAAEPALRAALAGISFVPGLKTEERVGPAYRNARLGYAVDLPSADCVDERNRVSVGPLGSSLVWKEPHGSAAVLATPIHPGVGSVEKVIEPIVSRMLPTLGIHTSAKPDRVAVSHAGVAGERHSWTGQTGRALVMYQFRRSNVLILVVAILEPGLPADRAESVRARLRLLD